MICRNGCGAEITWDPKQKSASGKSIPIDVITHNPHQCPNSDFAMKKKTPELGHSVIDEVIEIKQELRELKKMIEDRLTKLEMSRWS